jgi:DNA-binding NarL/FixJ family response regulator
MVPEQFLKRGIIGEPLKPIVPIEVDWSAFNELYWERDGASESEPLELFNTLKVLAYAAASKSNDCQEAARSLGLEFDGADFFSSRSALFNLLNIRKGRNPNFRLLKKAMEEDIIPSFPLLNPRQWEVLDLSALGLENQEISERLGTSLNSVEQHISSINSELGGNRMQSAITAMENGWVDLADLQERLGNRSPKMLKEQLDGLTSRGKEIALMIGSEGLSDKEIAWRLSLTGSTIWGHVVRILKKLNLRNRTEIAIFFFLVKDELDFDEEEIIQPRAPSPALSIIEEKEKERGSTEQREILIRILSLLEEGRSPEEIEEMI